MKNSVDYLIDAQYVSDLLWISLMVLFIYKIK